jgi:1-acyl-sn-glycerol-3-phosphate acyltransferase
MAAVEMMMNANDVSWLMWAVAGLSVVTLFLLVVVPQWRRFRAYHALVSRCGYLGPVPSSDDVRFFQRLSKLLVWIQVGKVRYENEEFLDTPGPRLIVANHGSAADPLIFGRRFNQPHRYMAAKGVFDFGFGIGSLFAARAGAFSADLTLGKGAPAKDAAVQALTSRQNVVMFPEGWAWLDGIMGTMKKGAVRIAKEAAQKLDEPIFIVPSYIRFGRYPGSWIRRLPPPVQYLLVLLLAPIYRRGATVVFGKPISSADLPKNDRDGTELVRQAIVACDPGPRVVRNGAK